MAGVDTSFKSLRRTQQGLTEDAVRAVFKDIRADAADSVKSGSRRLIPAAWNKVLAEVILDRNYATAVEAGDRVTKALSTKKAADDEEDDTYDPEAMIPWLTANADASARAINADLESKLRKAVRDDDGEDEDAPDPVDKVFDIAETSGAAGLAVQMVSLAVSFGSKEAASARGGAVKTWVVNSGNPRASHASMDGESADMDEAFSNGMMFPGDPVGGADEVAECQCSITIVR